MDDASEASQAYQRRVTEDVMRAIFEASITEIDGKKTAYVMTAEVCDALIDVMAGLLEGAPTCRTPQEMRKTADAVGKMLHVRLKGLRDLYKEGSPRLFDGDLTINPS
jgi:hypothetical protein